MLSWDAMFEAVGRWVRTHQGEGEVVNVRYPRRHSKDKDEKKLAKWVSNQQMNYHGKRWRVMNESRREMLENLPGWKWTARNTPSWEFMFRAVGKWVRMHQGGGEGVNVRYPSQYSKDKDEKKLAIWVNNQQMNYYGQHGRVMNGSRREMLESLPGWTWRSKRLKRS